MDPSAARRVCVTKRLCVETRGILAQFFLGHVKGLRTARVNHCSPGYSKAFLAGFNSHHVSTSERLVLTWRKSACLT